MLLTGAETFVDSGSPLAHAAVVSKGPSYNTASIEELLTAGVLQVSSNNSSYHQQQQQLECNSDYEHRDCLVKVPKQLRKIVHKIK